MFIGLIHLICLFNLKKNAMKDPRQRREFSDMSDDPRNNGWGINGYNPYDNYDERDEEEEPIERDDEEFENDND